MVGQFTSLKVLLELFVGISNTAVLARMRSRLVKVDVDFRMALLGALSSIAYSRVGMEISNGLLGNEVDGSVWSRLKFHISLLESYASHGLRTGHL